jgi:hypothetical protein
MDHLWRLGLSALSLFLGVGLAASCVNLSSGKYIYLYVCDYVASGDCRLLCNDAWGWLVIPGVCIGALVTWSSLVDQAIN